VSKQRRVRKNLEEHAVCLLSEILGNFLSLCAFLSIMERLTSAFQSRNVVFGRFST